MASILDWTPKMTPHDKRFYAQLGSRIAQFRKAQDLTQVQLAKRLGIAQQTMAHYEGANLRLPIVLLPALADALGVSVEALLGEPESATKGKRGPMSTLERQIAQIQSMPRAKQKFIAEMLDALIKQQQSA